MRITRGLATAMGCLSLIVITALAQVPGPPQFSADMSVTSPRERGMKGKMFMGPAGRMRMDMTTEGGNMSMITDAAKKTSYMVMHDQRMYMEMSAEGPAMGPMGRGPKMPKVEQMGADPCAGRTGVTCKMTGSEMMNGRMCDKWEFVSANKSEAGTTWVDQKTKMPIKSVRADGSTWELTNFKEGPQDPSLFAPPSGYQKFDMGQMMRGRQNQ
jgi:hypothetical protein